MGVSNQLGAHDMFHLGSDLKLIFVVMMLHYVTFK
jgi:hypothetical protein